MVLDRSAARREAAEVVSHEREPAVTITLGSAAKGSGTTFVATNLAYLLAELTGKRVALIDLDLRSGEVARALRLAPRRTMADVELDGSGRVDLAPLMTPHPGGFDVLAAPREAELAESLGPATVTAVVDAVRLAYDFVVIDTAPALDERVLAALDVTDHLLLVATLDLPSVRQLRDLLSRLDRRRVAQDGVLLVLNEPKGGAVVSADDLLRVLGRVWDLALPHDDQVARSAGPVIASAPRAEISKRLIAALPVLVPEASAP